MSYHYSNVFNPVHKEQGNFSRSEWIKKYIHSNTIERDKNRCILNEQGLPGTIGMNIVRGDKHTFFCL